jgi:acyl carrier protein
MKVTFIVAAIILAVIGVQLADWTTKRRARRHLAGRPTRSADEFGREFFPEHAVVASRVRNILGKHLPIDLAALCPDDRPVQDLRMDDLDSMSTVEFVIDIEKEFGIEIPDSDAEALRTVREIVEYIVGRLDQKKNAGDMLVQPTAHHDPRRENMT